MYGHLIESGGKLNRGDITSENSTRELMKETPKILDAEEAAVVAKTLGTLVRRPTDKDSTLPCIIAAAIESNHVHLLLAPLNEPIGIVAGRFKGKTSSAVLAMPQNKGRTRTWTAKYWKVFLFGMEALETVKLYVEDHNVRRGLPASPFPWISPVGI
jgi:REP element-mobilizing transposase RayT